MHPGKLTEIEHDALHPNPRVRNAFVSSKSLDLLNQGKLPEHEERLYEMFLERRDAFKDSDSDSDWDSALDLDAPLIDSDIECFDSD